MTNDNHLHTRVSDPAANPAKLPLHTNRWVILAAIVYPAGLYIGAQTIANAVLPQMQGDLAAGIDQISWVITASVVAGAIGIPPTGWLADRYGRRRVMLVSTLLFGLASMLVGFAESLGTVVLFRVLQSLVGAPLIALSQAITLDLFADEERGTALACWSIGALVGWVMAPSLGAYIAELHSWRVIFFVLLPLSLTGVLTLLLVPDSSTDDQKPFDWIGFGTVTVALVGFLVVLNRGQREDWFESTEIVLLTILSIVAVYYFVLHTTTTPHPFIRWRIFKDWNFSLGILITFVYAGMSLAPLVLIPTMLVELKGLELLTTGLVLIPRGITQIISLMFIGYLLTKFDPRLLSAFGFCLYALGGWPMVNFNLDIGWWDVVWPNMIQGAAMGFMLIPATTLLYSSLPQNLRVDGAVVLALNYNIASSIGVALAVTVLARTAQVNQAELAINVTPANELFRFSEFANVDFDSVASLSGIHAEVSQQALMVAYVNVFWAALIFALICAPLPLAFKLHKPD